MPNTRHSEGDEAMPNTRHSEGDLRARLADLEAVVEETNDGATIDELAPVALKAREKRAADAAAKVEAEKAAAAAAAAKPGA